MRNVSTLKRMALAVLFAGLFTSSYADAKKYYLSPEGSDDNDGLTEATAKASICGVITEIYKSPTLEQDTAGKVPVEVYVNGIIDITKEPARGGAWRDIIGNAGDYATGYPESLKGPDGVEREYRTWNANGGNMGLLFLDIPMTFIGKDTTTCGFTGGTRTRLFRIDGGLTWGAHTFRNLKFINGSNTTSDTGGGLYIRSVGVNFENCLFTQNRAMTRSGDNNNQGGAMVLIAATVNIDNCEFRHNYGGLGGAISWQGGPCRITNTLFYANNAVWDEEYGIWGIAPTDGAANKGGAIAMTVSNGKNSSFYAKNCRMVHNGANNSGGAVYFEETGAANNGVATPITFENCVMADNFAMSSWGGSGNADAMKGGGAVYLHSPVAGMTGFSVQFSLINTSIFANFAQGAGGAILCRYGREGNELNIINCTITENMLGSLDGNGYNAAGLRTLDTNAENDPAGALSPQTLKKRIWNTVIEGNHSSSPIPSKSDGSPDYALYYGDVNMQNAYIKNVIANLDLRNSWLGRISFGDQFAVEIKDNDGVHIGGGYIATEEEVNDIKAINRWNYSSAAGDMKGGFDLFSDFNYIVDEGYLSLPAENEGLTFGDARLLKPFSVTDGRGLERKFTDGKCAIGAIEQDSEVYPLAVDKNTVSDGDLTIYYAGRNLYVKGISESSVIKVNIFNTASQLIASVTESIGVGAFAQELPVNLASGIYAVQVIAGNRVKSILISVK